MRFACIALLAACGGSSSHPRNVDVIENTAPARPRQTPAPSIAWADNKLAVTGLPAVARGGEAIVVPISGGDAGRGYPNLTLEVHDRTDKTVQTIKVLASDEYERLAADGVASPALQKRIADANAELVRLHNVHDLVAMHALEMQKPVDGGDQ